MMSEEELLNKYLSDRNKAKIIADWGKDTTQLMGVGIMAITFTEHFAHETHTESYNNILELLRLSRDRKVILPELSEVINQNFAAAIALYEQQRQILLEKLLGDRIVEYNFLITQNDKIHIAEAIKNACFTDKKNKQDVYIYDCYERSLRIINPEFLLITPGVLQMKIDNDPEEILLALASVIDDPTRLAYQRDIIDTDYEKFPLKWYGLQMSIVNFRKYFRRFKAGQNIDDYVEHYVNPRLDFIKKRFDNHYFRHFAERGAMLHSVIDSYINANYHASICTCLPLIEGAILRFADYYHFIEGGVFNISGEKKMLIQLTGKENKDFTIGDIMNNSVLHDFFDQAFISYFCDELYTERNPMLHGTIVNGFDKLNAAKKILTFDYVAEVMDNFIFARYKKEMDEAMSEEMYQSLISSIEIEDEEWKKFKAKIKEIKGRRYIN